MERRKLEKALSKKGFEKEERDHHYYHLVVDGKRTGVFTKISHGSSYKVFGKKLVAKVARQMHLTRKDLEQFVACTLDEAGYVSLVRAKLAEKGRAL